MKAGKHEKHLRVQWEATCRGAAVYQMVCEKGIEKERKQGLPGATSSSLL